MNQFRVGISRLVVGIMKKSLWTLVGVLLAVWSLSAPAQANETRFGPSPCPFPLPSGIVEGEDVNCGYVLVPEDRTRQNSRTIRLAVAIFKANGPNALPDPLFYLDGGPGAATLMSLPLYLYEALVQPFVRQRDVIIFDQRGVGFSEPALNCDEFDQATYELLNGPILPIAEYDEMVRTIVKRCVKQFTGSDITLTAYNTTENAADVDAIRKALGYDQINLYGVSYGTFLAQYVMRHHPAHLRSVILDSVLPASVRAIEAYPANFERVFELLFSTCKADARCNTTYPNLETIFYETADRLNRKPILVENVSNPLTGATFDVWVDGNAFIGLIYQQFYLTHAIPQLPQRIFAAHNGQKRVLYDALVSYVTAPALSYEAMGLSVECADIVPHNDQARFDLAVASLEAARLRTYFETIRLDAIPRFIELCALWHPTDEDQTANLPVSSDIPTLIFAGQFDPVTPPEWGQQVAQSLPNGFYVEVPAHGHGVTNFSICPVNIAEAFLSDPHVRPNAGCAERQVLRFRY